VGFSCSPLVAPRCLPSILRGSRRSMKCFQSVACHSRSGDRSTLAKKRRDRSDARLGLLSPILHRRKCFLRAVGFGLAARYSLRSHESGHAEGGAVSITPAGQPCRLASRVFETIAESKYALRHCCRQSSANLNPLFTQWPLYGDKNLSIFVSIPSITYSDSPKLLHEPVLLFDRERRISL
jgi:hypothetical protein